MTVDREDEHACRCLVGQRLRSGRAWLGLTQRELAAKAGVSRNFVSAIERGTMSLDAWRLGLIAQALGTSVGWLLGEPDNSPPPGAPDSETRT